MTEATEQAQEQDYVVVINDEEQYSIWPIHRDIPAGWHDVGVRGPEAECLAHIAEVWTDMRPRSLRLQMEEWERNPPPPPEPLPEDDAPPLVERLTGEGHRVEIRTRSDDKVGYLRERIEIGHVHVLFPDTRGGTELGLALSEPVRNAALAALDAGEDVTLEGRLVLDETPVACSVCLRQPDLAGVGGLTVMGE